MNPDSPADIAAHAEDVSPDSPASGTTASSHSSVDSTGFQPIHESKEKQHYFNAPYQLAVLPSKVPFSQRRFFMADNPSDATRTSFAPLRPGDIIVMGTDGLFDNVFLDELATVLERELGAIFTTTESEGEQLLPEDAGSFSDEFAAAAAAASEKEDTDDNKSVASDRMSLLDADGEPLNNAENDEKRPMFTLASALRPVPVGQERAFREQVQTRIQRAADAMVREAASLALSSRISPFGQEARNHGWMDHSGGKVDDITVVTALVIAKQTVGVEKGESRMA